MIREIREDDRPKLREMGFVWEMQDDFLGGFVFVDASDDPVMVVGAWSRAEVHMGTKHDWQTPAARMFAMRKLHAAMEQRLAMQQVGEVVTYFSAKESFCKRLLSLGWVQSANTSWHRVVRGKF